MSEGGLDKTLILEIKTSVLELTKHFILLRGKIKIQELRKRNTVKEKKSNFKIEFKKYEMSDSTYIYSKPQGENN